MNTLKISTLIVGALTAAAVIIQLWYDGEAQLLSIFLKHVTKYK